MRKLLVTLAAAVLTVAGVLPAYAEADPAGDALTLSDLAAQLTELELAVRGELSLSETPAALPPRDRAARAVALLDEVHEVVDSARATSNDVLRTHYDSATDERIAASEANAELARALLDGLVVEAFDGGDSGDRIAVVDAWVDVQLAIDQLETLEAEVDATLVLPEPTHYCPVDGSVHIEDTWGARRPGGRSHKGTDIGAAYGTPVVAVEGGVIRQANYHRAGGWQLFLVADSGDEYFYAHLARYADGVGEGSVVGAGQLVGYVGTSGNADVPHVHFGLVPAGRAYPWGLTNPYPLISTICR